MDLRLKRRYIFQMDQFQGPDETRERKGAMKKHIVISVLVVAACAVLLNHYLSRERAASRHPAAVMDWNSTQPFQSLEPAQYAAAPRPLVSSNWRQRFQLQVIPSSQDGPATVLKLDTWTGEAWRYSEDTGKWLPVGNEPGPEAALDLPIQHFEVDAVVEDGDEVLGFIRNGS